VDEILRQPGGNRSQGAHRAWDDHHAGARKRTAGQRGRKVRFLVCVNLRWKVVVQRHPGFQSIDEPSCLR
jgi:hypothetical protein